VKIVTGSRNDELRPAAKRTGAPRTVRFLTVIVVVVLTALFKKNAETVVTPIGVE
jgi:hypothetical protein